MPESRLIHLTSDPALAAIAACGAEPVAWTAGGVKLLWTADPARWGRTAPLLFPVVGWSREGQVRVAGRTYPMPVHGFAADAEFTVTAQASDRVRLELTDSEATCQHYPFAFRLTVEWRLQPTSLSAAITVENPGPAAMPFALGLHPGFAWPLAGGARPPPHPLRAAGAGRGAGDRAGRALLGAAAGGAAAGRAGA